MVQYVRLALIEKTDVTIRDKSLNDITKLTLLGEVDKILKKKEPLGTLKEQTLSSTDTNNRRSR